MTFVYPKMDLVITISNVATSNSDEELKRITQQICEWNTSGEVINHDWDNGSWQLEQTEA